MDEYDGHAERIWTEAADAADLKKRIGLLPGFGKMKITGFGSVLALHFGVEAAEALVPEHPCLGKINSAEDLAEYQAAKRAHKAALRAAAARGELRLPAGPIALETLTDGGQRPADVARGIGDVPRARPDDTGHRALRRALRDGRGGARACILLAAVQRGVAGPARLQRRPPGPIPVPPPPETAPEAIEALPLLTRAIAGVPDLMHHKFVVRDGEAVLAGSTNWTDDSWSRQENVIVTLASREIAYAYTLGDSSSCGRAVTSSEPGEVDPRPEDVGPARVRAWFCPEHGEALSHRVAKHIGKAQQAGADRVARPHVRADPRDARRGRERAALRRGRGRRRHAGRPGLRPVADERRERVEDPAPPTHPRGRRVQRQDTRRRGRRRRSTTSCTPRSSSPTTRRSSAASTSRARASGTPRTSSRSATRRSPTGRDLRRRDRARIPRDRSRVIQ